MKVPNALSTCAPRTEADRCPGVLRLHETLDGRLARVRLPGGRASARQLAALAAGARLGSGIVEITSRANLQLRGLPSDSAETLAEILGAAGLLPSSEHERARNILASPLAGRHPLAIGEGDMGWADDLVAAIDAGLRADPDLARLPGRFLFLVEDGSGLLRDADHDVALLAPPSSAGPEPMLVLAGQMTALRAPLTEAAGIALDAARAFLALRKAGDAWRISELVDGAEAVAAKLGTGLVRTPIGPAADPPVPGPIRQRDGQWAITALAPLARLAPEQLEELAVLAERGGAEVRFSPWRTLTLIDVPEAELERATHALAAAGLVLDPESGWRGLSACAGLGACVRALGDVRAAAAARAAARPPAAPAEHWTACERRCGERAQSPIAASIGAESTAVRINGYSVAVAGLDEALALLARETAEEELRP